MLKLKKIKPVFTSVVTTADKYTEDEVNSAGLIVRTAGEMKPVQRVVAVGDIVKCCKVGDVVMINPKRYTKVMQDRDNSIKDVMVESYKNVVTYEIPQIELDGKTHLFIEDRDIDFVVEEYEDKPENSKILVPKKEIII